VLKRSTLLATLALAAMLAAPAAQAEWPDRPIHFIVGFGPGGANDLIGRIAADGAGKELSLLLKDLPYKDSDLVPVGMIAVAPSTIIVNPSVPATNMKEFIAWAKAQNGKATWATAGNGSTPEFVAEMISEATGVKFNIIPYKSGGASVHGVMNNEVSATSEASIVVVPQIKAGTLKGIATTYTKRISSYPQIPTTAEQGFPTVQIGHWAGLYAPAGTPQPIIDKMNAALQAALKNPENVEKLTRTGIEPAGGSVADFVAFTKAERARLSELATHIAKTKEK